MVSGTTSLPVRGAFGQTSRTDVWWVQPVAVFLGLGLAIAYLTFAAFQGEYYTFGNYLSPLYSPERIAPEEDRVHGKDQGADAETQRLFPRGRVQEPECPPRVIRKDHDEEQSEIEEVTVHVL